MKFIINNLFSSDKSKESVACLDLDPGQPEMCLPGCISLTEITKPLLGQAFTHYENTNCFKCLKEKLLGCVSVSTILHKYIKIVQSMIDYFNSNCENIPLVINTMGWTRDIGLDIIVDLIRIIKPTHVIQLDGSNPGQSFPIELTSEAVTESNRNIVTKSTDYFSINHKLILLKSGIDARHNKHETSRAKDKRTLRILSYFTQLWDSDVEDLNALTVKNIIKVPWTDVGLHVLGKNVPRSHILLALNSSLVALTKIDPSCLETENPNHPKYINNNTEKEAPECIGWGIIRGIDTDTKEIHIMTPITETVFKKQVNCIIQSAEICLPETLLGLFGTGKCFSYSFIQHINFNHGNDA